MTDCRLENSSGIEVKHLSEKFMKIIFLISTVTFLSVFIGCTNEVDDNRESTDSFSLSGKKSKKKKKEPPKAKPNPPPAVVKSGVSIRDFLVQDVCLDRSGNTITADPADSAKCPSRRDINPDEDLPYFKSDFGPNVSGPGWQRSDSIPMRDFENKDLILKTFDFGGPRMVDNVWGDFKDFQDGWDLTELGGNFVSYIGTKDGNNDNHWAGACGKLDDGWVLFPTLMEKGRNGNLTHDIYGVPVNENCAIQNANKAHAAWHWLPNPIRYSGGRVLESISTHHFDSTSISSAKSFELNYYTREYGATRWESWEKCPSGGQVCEPSVDANECSGDRVATISGARWVRKGCRDWTYIHLTKVDRPKFWVGLVQHRMCSFKLGGASFHDPNACQKVK